MGDRRADGINVRRARPEDRPAILTLLIETMGWNPADPNAEFFAWKHDQNPFGASPMWVAEDEGTGRLAGVRAFMRWEFVEPGGRVVRAVRAVDTATHPDYQGRGLFTLLTMTAVDELTAEGVDFVFNTPNDKSRPGYLKMGWRVVGKVPIRIRPRTPLVLPKLVSSRVPAEKWGERLDVGDNPATLSWVPAPSPTVGLATRTCEVYLRWRFSFAPLGYRALHDGDDLLVFRVRRRGAVRELSVSMLNDAGRLVRRALRLTRADIALGITRELGPRAGRQGIVVTARPLSSAAPHSLEDWNPPLADLELF